MTATAQPLTSRSAPVAAARLLRRSAGRREAGRFLVEGPQSLREALAADAVLEVFATPAAATRHAELLAGVPTLLVDDRALAALADSVTPQGLVGVAPLLTRPLEDLPAAARLVCVLVEPRDPGNLGTIIRTADAAGADAVVVVGDAVDVHNGKVVRSSAGSLWHLPVVACDHLAAAATALSERGVALLAADGAADLDLPSAEAGDLLTAPTAWVFGTEAHGLPQELAALCEAAIRVPLHGGAESLNLASAAAVCLYASARAQRWQNPRL